MVKLNGTSGIPGQGTLFPGLMSLLSLFLYVKENEKPIEVAALSFFCVYMASLFAGISATAYQPHFFESSLQTLFVRSGRRRRRLHRCRRRRRPARLTPRKLSVPALFCFILFSLLIKKNFRDGYKGEKTKR